jgi:hypothetical protein
MICPNPTGDCRRTYKGVQQVKEIILTSSLDTHSLRFKDLAKVLVSNDILICYFYVRLGNAG